MTWRTLVYADMMVFETNRFDDCCINNCESYSV